MAWLFIQLVMISAWSPGISASPALAGQAVAICTGDGLVTIYFDADGNPIEGDTGQHNGILSLMFLDK